MRDSGKIENFNIHLEKIFPLRKPQALPVSTDSNSYPSITYTSNVSSPSSTADPIQSVNVISTYHYCL